MRRYVIAAAWCIAITAVSYGQALDPSAALRENEAQWNRDWAAHDLDKVVAHYTEDGSLILAGGPPIKGRGAIRRVFQSMTADPAFALTFSPSNVIVSRSGGLAYTEGTYNLTLTDPASRRVVHDHGTYVTNYRKTASGEWKAVLDITASSVSLPAQAAAPSKGH